MSSSDAESEPRGGDGPGGRGEAGLAQAARVPGGQPWGDRDADLHHRQQGGRVSVGARGPAHRSEGLLCLKILGGKYVLSRKIAEK